MEFQEREFALLDSKNIRLKIHGPKKLLHRFFGLFERKMKIEKLAYELIFPLSIGVHNVFYVSLVKP